jgi:hypothetical protein
MFRPFKAPSSTFFRLLILTFIVSSWGSYSPGSEEKATSIPQHSITIEDISDESELSEEDIEGSASSRQPHGKMVFKLGFEFQEENGLCPWALTDINIQKKRLFSIVDFKQHKPLHVVIDGNDIEFVTRPFSYKEPQDLSICMDLFLGATNLLEDLLSKDNQITFEKWVTGIREQIKKFSFSLKNHKAFAQVKDQYIIKPSLEWKAKFTPQVTIQHPLEYAIPLYFALFGFESPYMFNLSASLPLRDEFLKAQKQGNSDIFSKIVYAYSNVKMNGLAFLQALTLLRMAPVESSSSDLIKEKLLKEKKKKNKSTNIPVVTEPKEESGNEEQEWLEVLAEKFRIESDTLQTTLKYFESSHQVDPKMQLILMSRRPFSSMFADINVQQGEYSEYFEMMMGCNIKFQKIPFLFNSTNYGEQFYDELTGDVKSLLHFKKFFEEEFYDQHEEVLDKLLKQGVLTTTMIRNFKDEVMVDDVPIKTLLENYYQSILDSIQSPKNRIIINVDNARFESIPTQHDALSPPWFLNSDNSMGAYNQEMPEEEKEFGEAIIEVRAIPYISPWFLRKCDLKKDITGSFLRIPGSTSKEHALKLFSFLSNFGSEQDKIEIFYLGMAYSLREY